MKATLFPRLPFILIATALTVGCIDSGDSEDSSSSSSSTSIDKFTVSGVSEKEGVVQLAPNEPFELDWKTTHSNMRSIRFFLSETPEIKTGPRANNPRIFSCDEDLVGGRASDHCKPSTHCMYGNDNLLTCEVRIEVNESSVDMTGSPESIFLTEEAYIVMRASKRSF